MEVFRVENRLSHKGPFYNAGWAPNKYGLCLMKHNDEYNGMPSPKDDGIDWVFDGPNRMDNPTFAFPSMALFVDFWRIETLKDLQELGHVLVTLDVPFEELAIGKSGLQVAFDGFKEYPILSTKELVDTYMIHNFSLMG